MSDFDREEKQDMLLDNTFDRIGRVEPEMQAAVIVALEIRKLRHAVYEVAEILESIWAVQRG